MVGEVRQWEWTVTQPVGSRSSFQPSPTFHSPTFDANVLGTYEFCLNVWDSEGEGELRAGLQDGHRQLERGAARGAAVGDAGRPGRD